MRVGRFIFATVVKSAASLSLIVVLLLAARDVASPARAWFEGEVETLRSVPAQQAAYEDAAERFRGYARDRQEQIEAEVAHLARRSDAALVARQREAESALQTEERAILSVPALMLASAGGQGQRVFAHYHAKAEIPLLRAELRQIEQMLRFRGDQLNFGRQRARAAADATASFNDFTQSKAEVASLESRFMAPQRDALCRLNPTDLGCESYRRLQAAIRRRNQAMRRNSNAWVEIRAIDRARKAVVLVNLFAKEARATLRRQELDIAGELHRLDQQARNGWLLTASRAVRDVFPEAVFIFFMALASPLGLKALLYFGVAPLASRRSAVRLSKDDQGEVRQLTSSAVSQEVALAPGEELLVVPEALQSSPHDGQTRTRWLLSWRLPLSSFASGLVGLTQIRVPRLDTVLVSATGGPVSEIALIRIERGSSFVLRPRALRGIVHDYDKPLRIDRCWRFGLTAWLTLQFRYLVFHGPVTFIVQGTRGARLEDAGRGRGINQAATLGFSAGLYYRVRPSETFGAYLFGKQALFNDSFEGEAGSHLHEEMLPQGRLRDPISRYLQGIGDAALKLVGL